MNPDNQQKNSSKDTDPKPTKKRRHLKTAKRAFKWLAGIFLTFVALVLIFVTLVVWILTPEKLTPLIEKYGSEYLVADVHLSRAELTFWSTFPRLKIDIDSLELISRAMDKLPAEERRQVPAYADSLLSVRAFHGGVNILKLLTGKVELYNLEINHPVANLVVCNDSVANYNIVPPSEEPKDTARTRLPEISINKFLLADGAPIRFVSMPDSMDIGLYIKAIALDDVDNPLYSIDVQGDASALIPDIIDLKRLPILINGGVSWNHKTPSALAFDDFMLGVGPVRTVFSTDVDFTDDIVVSNFKGSLEQVKIMDIIEALPENYRHYADGLKTDLSVGGKVVFEKPYHPVNSPIPFAHVDINVPEGSLSYQELKLTKVAMVIGADIKGDNLDRAVINLKRLVAETDGMGFGIKATATNIITDPAVDGEFSGGLNFKNIPKKLMSSLPVTLKGELRGKFDFALNKSYLTLNQFHRIRLNGAVSIKKLDVTQSELGARLFSNFMELKLGSNDSFIRNEYRSDSLLTASLRCDSLYVGLPGMTLTSANLLLGAGAQNRAASIDNLNRNHNIIPMGAVFKVDRLNFSSSVDSMNVRLRNTACRASLQRFEDHARVPLLKFSMDAGSMRYKDPMNRVSFRDTKIEASCHARLKPQMSAKMSVVYDSIAARHPRLRADSIYSLTRAHFRDMHKSRTTGMTRRNDGSERLDYGLDNSTKSWLRWLNFSAHLTSKRARLFTPYFPVRNRLSNLDLTLTSDSLAIHNTRYEMGRSDFTINGSITNLSQALTSRRQTLKIDLELRSDTIDVNQIAEAAFKGSAFAEKVAKGYQFNLGDSDNDDLMQAVIDQTAASDETAPLLIPVNVDATLRISARNIIYSDLLFHRFRGEALIHEGALNLHRLTASTDIGSVALSALYTAPTRDDLSFAFGMQIKDFYIEKFMQLIPAVDSLMPLLRDIKGVINADVAATSKVDPAMNLVIPSLSAAIKITGDSLVLLDAETFRTIAKWMLFKNKSRNMVDHMEVQVVVENSMLELFPFLFQIDRYKLGVMGSNDLAMNYNYHVSVLQSPIPFKFGINVKGNPDKMKIRLGRAKFKENMMVERVALVDTTRINLLNQIENVFRRGVKTARVGSLNLKRPDNSFQNDPEAGDTISAADSLLFIKEGLIPAPPKPAVTEPVIEPKKGKRNKKK